MYQRKGYGNLSKNIAVDKAGADDPPGGCQHADRSVSIRILSSRQKAHSNVGLFFFCMIYYVYILYSVGYEKNKKLEFCFLPPYSPDLNAVERAWWYMRKKNTNNRYLKTLKERKNEFWKMFSLYQKPNEELKTVCEINY